MPTVSTVTSIIIKRHEQMDLTQDINCCSVYSGCINSQSPNHQQCIETLRPSCNKIGVNYSGDDCSEL